MRKSKPAPKAVHPTDPLSGSSPRHETAGCPTGLDPGEAQLRQEAGGGGAPGTGNDPDAKKSDDDEDSSRKNR
jgi:hypothetical protein